ncbi:hypothetical protein, partial [Pseudomonas sp. Sample_9]|uniref:hypothetical protein n=1 Tax=Pseudomonas sp. Sample_9 TaxID=2382158 RepID=UPI0019D632B5
PALGAGCQEFESPYPDHIENPRIERYGDFFCLPKGESLQVVIQPADSPLIRGDCQRFAP